ncbi:methyltransferase type 12 [Dactylonectria estremocensis]|uniref:Methyltransferase type 12 n=1 Tax=Dactylonectria estremocensis TaxID=1079267 RepID=A0A9P9FDA6_9HYPO|nr:methyltransferase type 12 [Dactylonectria estremocensis]
MSVDHAHPAHPAPVGPDASLSRHLPPIEPDSTEFESDIHLQNTDFCDSHDALSRTSSSISSSIRDYSFENARRYHKFREGRYQFPNDEPEQEREHMKHVVAVHLLQGKLHLAPLHRPLSILDLGTGTGSWAIDMSDEYPDAEIVGIDLSPIQPAWVPPKVKFVVDDAEARWLSPPGSVDLVHLRNMSTAIKDWPALLAQAYEALKPGAWIEIQDFRWAFGCDDGTMPPDYGPAVMTANVAAGLAHFGVELFIATSLPDRVAAAGFVKPVHSVRRVPVGPWPRNPDLKTIGLYTRGVIFDGLQAVTLGPLTRGLQWTPEAVEDFLVKVRRDLMKTSVHSHVFFHCLYAQKPLDDGIER